jgi:hypothetical protein
MMRPKNSNRTTASKQPESVLSSDSKPESELMSRLARGAKAEVSKEEMLKLTRKNYDLLPEVKKKREEERKRAEFKQR